MLLLQGTILSCVGIYLSAYQGCWTLQVNGWPNTKYKKALKFTWVIVITHPPPQSPSDLCTLGTCVKTRKPVYESQADGH